MTITGRFTSMRTMAIREVPGDSAFPGAAYPVMMQQPRAASA
jgi:hypothetical protein